MNLKSIVVKMDRSIPGQDVPHEIKNHICLYENMHVCVKICFPF